ncbi:MAG: adenosylmethionine--8-amino-7-oxononanoate transaminase [Cellvibrionales bacterium]|nr:adenosylmethionine--8-amino-7-oxononanoate transaminase [Cellvibrionales bacterium]
MTNPDFDRDHLWHPYTSITNPLPTYEVSHCQDVYIHLTTGEALIDGMSSWWSVIHGYNHPILNQALIEQSQKMSHVMFGGLTHNPAITLGQKLLAMTQEVFDQIFLADSGSVSVEAALKMALQYQQGIGQHKKTRLGALLGGYHGDTLGAMSVCDPENGMHTLFNEYLPNNHFLPRPTTKPNAPLSEEDKNNLQMFFEAFGDELAAVIVEPLVQGAGGMYFYDKSYLKALKHYCEKYGTLLIFDEIATGFGRAGELFAFIEADVIPDILCLGKALTGGYMTLAATLCSEKVSTGICQSEAGVFMHGPTYMGNPLACAVANASCDLLLESPWQAQIQRIEKQLQEALLPLAASDNVQDARVKGAIGVLEMKEAIDVASFQRQCVADGVWIRPFGKLLYIMPPYIINHEALEKLTDTMRRWT